VARLEGIEEVSMNLIDKIGFLLMKIPSFWWKLCRREYFYSIRKMRRDEKDIVYFDKVFERRGKRIK